MLNFEYDNNTYEDATCILVSCDADDTNITMSDIIEAMACSIDIDFEDMTNGGYPEYWGNDYAVYGAIINGVEYSITPIDANDLNENRLAVLVPRN